MRPLSVVGPLVLCLVCLAIAVGPAMAQAPAPPAAAQARVVYFAEQGVGFQPDALGSFLKSVVVM